MRPVGTHTAIAEQAAADPPKSFLAFRLTEILQEAGGGCRHWVEFDVSCKACGHDTFHVGWFPLVGPDPSPYYDVLPGEIVRRPPHRLRCSACGVVGTIFDARTDGHDGLVGGGCAYKSGEAGEVFTEVAYQVAASPTYNAELSELEDMPLEVSTVKPTDLFDCLTIVATPVGGGLPIELSYECA
jgi:hypothetical protein